MNITQIMGKPMYHEMEDGGSLHSDMYCGKSPEAPTEYRVWRRTETDGAGASEK